MTGQRVVRFGTTVDLRGTGRDGDADAADYARVLDFSAAAERHGLDSVWLSEHHFVASGYSPSLLTLAGAVLARSTALHVSTYVFLLPLHHPVRVAEDVAVLDVLSNGRMQLGVGMGYRKEEYKGLGIDPRTRVSRMDECCDLLIRSWTERGWSHRGRHFDLEGVDVWPRPVQEPHPRLWVSARTPAAAARAGRLKASLLLPPPGFVDDELDVYRAYASALADAGGDPDDLERYRVGRYLTPLVRQRKEHERPERVRRPLPYSAWMQSSLDGDAARSRPKVRPATVAGSAEVCAEAIAALLTDPVPTTDVIMGLHTAAQIAAVAEDVLPLVRHSGLPGRPAGTA